MGTSISTTARSHRSSSATRCCLVRPRGHVEMYSGSTESKLVQGYESVATMNATLRLSRSVHSPSSHCATSRSTIPRPAPVLPWQRPSGPTPCSPAAPNQSSLSLIRTTATSIGGRPSRLRRCRWHPGFNPRRRGVLVIPLVGATIRCRYMRHHYHRRLELIL